MLVITHTPEAGTLIDGTAKGDGTAPILKRCGWRWGRSISTWYLAHSRDRRPKLHIITRTQAELTRAGYDVSLDIDDTVRAAVEVEAATAARAADRVKALEVKADRRRADEARAWKKADDTLGRLPEGGEPIKVGHHSEKRHRRDVQSAHTSLGRAVEAQQDVEAVEARLRAAQSATARRYSPGAVARRIDKLEAQLRGTERILNGYTRSKGTPYAEWQPPAAGAARTHHESVRAEVVDKIAYWTAVRDEQIATGQATNYSKDTVSKGDRVRVWGHWRTVVRANPKTVSLATGYSWTDKVAYHEIEDVKHQ
jgi:hypothetical protein